MSYVIFPVTKVFCFLKMDFTQCQRIFEIVIDVNVHLSQAENATSPTQRRTNCCCLLVLQQSVGILEITHWRLLQTGIPTNNPFTWLIRHSALLTLSVSVCPMDTESILINLFTMWYLSRSINHSFWALSFVENYWRHAIIRFDKTHLSSI